MNEIQKHYRTLGVSRNSTLREVKKAYQKLALLYHPDKNQGNEKRAMAKFLEIGESYKAVLDERKLRNALQCKCSQVRNNCIYVSRNGGTWTHVAVKGDGWTYSFKIEGTQGPISRIYLATRTA